MHVPAILPARVAGTATIEAGLAVSTVEVAQRVRLPRNPAAIVRKTGIVSRRFTGPDESPAELGRRALEKALLAAGLCATERAEQMAGTIEGVVKDLRKAWEKLGDRQRLRKLLQQQRDTGRGKRLSGRRSSTRDAGDDSLRLMVEIERVDTRGGNRWR